MNLTIGVDLDGENEMVGLRINKIEGAQFLLQVLTEMTNALYSAYTLEYVCKKMLKPVPLISNGFTS